MSAGLFDRLNDMTSLTPRTLAEVLLKLWAVTLAVQVVLAIPNLVAQIVGINDQRMDGWRLVAGWTLVHILLTAIAAIAVFKFAREIATWIAGSPEELGANPTRAASFEQVAFGALGAYFLVEGLRDCALLIFQLSVKPRYINDDISYLWEQSASNLAGAAVQTLAGVALLLGRNGLARGWQKVRGTRDAGAS